MIKKISESVSVAFLSNCQQKDVSPKWIIWNNRRYVITKIGLHHSYRNGNTLFHVFSVASKSLSLRLVLNTDTLFWRLEEVSDGLVN